MTTAKTFSMKINDEWLPGKLKDSKLKRFTRKHGLESHRGNHLMKRDSPSPPSIQASHLDREMLSGVKQHGSVEPAANIVTVTGSPLTTEKKNKTPETLNIEEQQQP